MFFCIERFRFRPMRELDAKANSENVRMILRIFNIKQNTLFCKRYNKSTNLYVLFHKEPVIENIPI